MHKAIFTNLCFVSTQPCAV